MKLYSDDWQIRVTTAVTIAVCLGAAWFLGPATGVHGVWFIMLSVVVGMVLGRQVGRFLFRSPTDRA